MARSVWFDNFYKKVHGMLPVIMMLLVQTAYAVMNILYKLAANDGMSMTVLVAYRFIFAFGFITPIAFFVERKKRPKLTWTVLFEGFLCGLFGGSLAQNLYLEGLYLTSPTFTSTMSNLIPSMTFIVAVFLRYEKLGIRTIVGQAKVLGTLIGISGAMLLTFYKGVMVPIPSIEVFHIHEVQKNQEAGNKQVFGALAALGSCSCYIIWLMIQARMGKKYPFYYSSTSLMCGFTALQSTIYSMSTEKGWSQWKLGWNVRLLTVAFSGIVGTGLSITLLSWCVQLKGPLFVSIFNPLKLVLVALISSILLDEKLHLGSVIGAVLIVSGLYVILWAKGREMKKHTQLVLPDNLKEESNKAIKVIIKSESGNNHIGITDLPSLFVVPLEIQSEVPMVRCSNLNNIEHNPNNPENKEEIEEVSKKTTNHD